MSVRYFCDRCGTEFKYHNTRDHANHRVGGYDIELCTTCNRDLVEFMKGVKK